MKKPRQTENQGLQADNRPLVNGEPRFRVLLKEFEMPEVAQRWGFDIGLVAMGHNAIGGVAVAFWNAMGMIAVAVL